MKPVPSSNVKMTKEYPATEHARSRVLILLAVCLLLGIGGAGFWLAHRASRHARQPGPEANTTLSDATKAVLNRLDAPVEIRFYSILDHASVPPALFAYAEQVTRLLAQFQQEGNGKINVVPCNSLSDSTSRSAAADGLKPFNLDKGSACYFGLAVACNDKRETLSDLAPEWGPALEFDLSRAIQRVSGANPPAKPSAETAQIQAAAAQQVLSAIPNPAAVSVEDGTQVLRDAALKEFKAAVEEMEVRVRAAQQQVTQAQQSGFEPEQRAALERLQQVQAERAEKVKQIAAKLEVQIEAFKQIKAK